MPVKNTSATAFASKLSMAAAAVPTLQDNSPSSPDVLTSISKTTRTANFLATKKANAVPTAAPKKATKIKKDFDNSQQDESYDLYDHAMDVDHSPLDDRNEDEFDLDNLPSTVKPVRKRTEEAILQKNIIKKNAVTSTASALSTKASVTAASLLIAPTHTETPPRVIPQDYIELKQAYEELFNRFGRLTELRETKAEQLLKEYQRVNLSRHEAADKLIKALKEENEQLKTQQPSTGVQASGSRSSLGGLSDIINGVITGTGAFGNSTGTNLALIELFQTLTGLSLSAIPGEPDGEAWHGHIEGRQGAYSFELRLNKTEQCFIYTPMRTLPHLPSYLKEEIVFAIDQGQAFFWRVLNFLMQQSK